MWVFVHVCVGLAIGASLELPWWALALLAFGSHVALDLVPHWDYTRTGRMVLWGWVDFVSSLGLLLALWLGAGMPFWLVVLGPISGAPDFDVLLYAIRGGDGRKYFVSHWDRFPHGSCGPVPGIAVQAAIIVLSLVLVWTARPW